MATLQDILTASPLSRADSPYKGILKKQLCVFITETLPEISNIKQTLKSLFTNS